MENKIELIVEIQYDYSRFIDSHRKLLYQNFNGLIRGEIFTLRFNHESSKFILQNKFGSTIQGYHIQKIEKVLINGEEDYLVSCLSEISGRVKVVTINREFKITIIPPNNIIYGYNRIGHFLKNGDYVIQVYKKKKGTDTLEYYSVINSGKKYSFEETL